MRFKLLLLYLGYVTAHGDHSHEPHRLTQQEQQRQYQIQCQCSNPVQEQNINNQYALIEPIPNDATTQKQINLPRSGRNPYLLQQRNILNPTAIPDELVSPSLVKTPLQEYPQPAQTYVGSRQVNSSKNSQQKFNTKLFNIISQSYPQANIIYSPVSVQTLLVFLFVGATGNTANELQKALEVPEDRAIAVATFETAINELRNNRGAQPTSATKLFYSPTLTFQRNFDEIAKIFETELEPAQFTDPTRASNQINNWVAGKTQNRISSIVTPQTLDANTNALLVNTIYFKALWEKQFSTSDTLKDRFYNENRGVAECDMMYNDDRFRYGRFTDLKAQVVELPYQNSDMSMLILLPDELHGLADVERKLKNVDMGALSNNLVEEQVTLRLPKFRMLFEIDMTEPLKRLGVNQLFSNNAELRKMFQANHSFGVSKIQQKVFLDVNEAGSEVAAASFANIIPLALTKTIVLTVNHPFLFIIRNPRSIYFIGHVTNL